MKRIVISLVCILMLIVTLSFAVSAETYVPIVKSYDYSNEYKASKYYTQLNSINYTGDGRTDVILTALSQLGYHEGDSEADMGGNNLTGNDDFCEYNRLFGKYTNGVSAALGYGYAWCCSFTTWCANRAGIPESVVKAEISCQRLVSWFKENSTYKEAASGYVPVCGDLVFFKEKGSNVSSTHIGIAVSVKNGRLLTVEGNRSGGGEPDKGLVTLGSYDLSDSFIVGYGVPAYTENKEKAIDFNALTTGTYVISEKLNVRSKPSMEGGIIGGLEARDIVEVTEVSDYWGKITIDGKNGWISLNRAAFYPNTSGDCISFDANGGDGSFASVFKAKNGSIVIPDYKPTQKDHTFSGWSADKNATIADYKAGDIFSNDGDATLYAIWGNGTFTVMVYTNDTVFNRTAGIAPGKDFTFPENKGEMLSPEPKSYSVTFAGWDTNHDGVVDVKSGDKITVNSDIIAVPVFEKSYINYSIKFIGYNGEVLFEKNDFRYDDPVLAPVVNSVRDKNVSHDFAGWDSLIAPNVNGNKVYTAKFTESVAKYSVKFLGVDGNVLNEYKCEYEAALPGDAVIPTKDADNTYTYTFKCWKNAVDKITEDIVLTPEFEASYIDYTVSFVNYDNTVISENKYHYGDTPSAPAVDPTKASDLTFNYVFAGWDSEIKNVTGNAVYTAKFNPEKILYTVTFCDDDGSVLSTATYGYGDIVSFPVEAPSKAGYSFDGWTPSTVTVTGNMSYIASYTVSKSDGSLVINVDTTNGDRSDTKNDKPTVNGCFSSVSAGLLISLITVFSATAVFKKHDD